MSVRWLALITVCLCMHVRAAAQDEPALPAPVAEPAAESGDAPVSLSVAAEPEAQTPDTTDLTEAELENLGLSAEGGETSAVDTTTRINGFVDFGMYNVLTKAWRKALQPHPSFFIGNFNVYISKALSDTVRMFAEVRFTYLPNGVADVNTNLVTSTSVADYTNFSAELKWGGIEIERVYLEWSITPWLALRAGQFLTPYGIWNVDHGSPTIISVIQPVVIARQLFPERQTGLELRGQLALSAQSSIGYHLTLSNGLGPASDYVDLDDNKAVGARVWWLYEGYGQLTLGGSGFIGTDADTQMLIGLGSDEHLKYTERVNAKSTVLSLAADVQWRLDGLLLQAEFASRQTVYTKDGRPALTHPLTGVRAGLPDAFDYGYYFLAGYRFEWLGVMPYVVAHFVEYLERRLLLRPKTYVFEAGLNIRPMDSVVFKIQYQGSYWPDGFVVADYPFHSIYLQLAWAF